MPPCHLMRPKTNVMVASLLIDIIGMSVHHSHFSACHSLRSVIKTKASSYGTGRIFDRLKNLTRHFVHTEPFNIFVLFARNFIIVRLKCFRVNGTPKRTKPVSRIFFVRKWEGKSLGNRVAKRTNFQLIENSFSAV